MADTIFNIFGDHPLSNPVHKQILRINKSDENAAVGKFGYPSTITPAKKSINSLTPRHKDTSVKKSFLQNVGTPMQLKGNGGYRNDYLHSQKKVLHIYEDKPASAETEMSEEDLIRVEYTARPVYEDDGDLSDCDMMLSEQQIDSLVLDIPGRGRATSAVRTRSFTMCHPLVHISLDDILSEDSHDVSFPECDPGLTMPVPL